MANKFKTTIKFEKEKNLEVLDVLTIEDELTITEELQTSFVLTAGAVDQAVSLGQVSTAKRVIIESDRALTVKINSGTESIPCDTVLFLTGAITAIALTNTDASNNANVTVKIGGE